MSSMKDEMYSTLHFEKLNGLKNAKFDFEACYIQGKKEYIDSGDETKEICRKADVMEKKVFQILNSKVNELGQLLQASMRQKRINSYEKYEGNDMNRLLNFYK